VKRRTFYHLSLSLPYIALLLSGAFIYLVQGSDPFSSSSTPGILGGVLLFFTLSSILWAPLYTWMVAVMLFWGRGKTEDEVRTLYLLSPIILACAMGIPALLVDMPGSGMLVLWGVLHMNHLDFVIPALFKNFSMQDSLSVGFTWAFMAALCILIGYIFVGCVLLIEREMNRRGLFREEMSSGEVLPVS
jgi:hypothetical protein